jgi:predicted HicB family RNase H-like nuclease
VSKHIPYTYRVFWSEEDARWVGTCTEFPSLSHLAPDPGAAVTGIRDLIDDVVEDMRANGELVPEPLSSKTYSGKFIVRVPPELHRRLVIEAAEAQVSLNLLVSHRLSLTATDTPPKSRQGPGSKRRKAEDPGTADDVAPSRGFGGGPSGKLAQRKRGRNKAPTKRPKQAA